MLRYHVQLLLYMRHNHFSYDDAEDLLQDIWTAVAVHFCKKDFYLEQPFNAWLFTIARYKVVDEIRRRKHKARLDPEYDIPDTHESPVKFDYNFLVNEMNKVLTHREKDIFIRHFVEDMTELQIADLLGIGESTVSTHVSNARAKLKAHFRLLGIKGWEL